MSIAFIDLEKEHRALWPLTLTKPAAELRVGILTIREKWENFLGETAGYYTQEYLQDKFHFPSSHEFLINGRVIPDRDIVEKIKQLTVGEALYQGELFIASRSSSGIDRTSQKKVPYELDLQAVEHAWDIFRQNGQQIKYDYQIITEDRHTAGLTDKHTRCYGNDIFVEEGAIIHAAIFNAQEGPIYIGKNARVHEGAIIKGPFALCEGSHVNMGAKIKGDSTIGPFSKVGGEISNSVIQGYSNKAHDGFLGNSVIGEWCNLGADTNNSNLKNNYTNVKMWEYASSRFKDTEMQFCGLIMGDHSKCGINTMFNTGTTIGVSANIYGGGFPRNFIPSFAWGGAGGFMTYKLDKALETAELVMQRRNVKLSEADRSILETIFNISAKYRVWDKKD